MEITSLRQAKESANISTRNSKMPGSSFAISATKCKVGAKLAQVKGSVCHGCYALRIEKMRPSVHMGWNNNYEKAVHLIETNPTQWIAACVYQINRQAEKTGQPYHRWFDSGDLQSVAMLEAIYEVARQTPDINHWLPTREAKMVKQVKNKPSNIVVRISSTMVDDGPTNNEHTSTVHTKKGKPTGHICPASKQGNQCLECRACWSHDVANISYPKH